MARRATESDVARPSGLSDADIRAAASEILAGESGKSGYQRLAPFLGPAFIAAVAYVDPGNFATNIQAGAEFGYLLVWVIVASNLMAMLIQSLSAKLGIATGKNLAEVCRERFRKPVVYWLPGMPWAEPVKSTSSADLPTYLMISAAEIVTIAR